MNTKLILSALALVGSGFLLLADSTNECGELEPLPADFSYELTCSGQDASQNVSVRGMFIRQHDDSELRNQSQTIQPKALGVTVNPTILWDRMECSGGEGVGHVDGINVETHLSTAQAGTVAVNCSGPRASAMTSHGELSCQVLGVTPYAAPSGSSPATRGPDDPASDAGASDAGSGEPSSWSGLSCKMSIEQLPVK